jgi:hypothetical protein
LEGSQAVPAVRLVRDLLNFFFKDVGEAVVGEMSDFGRAILWRKILKFESSWKK